jgi:cytochrome c oxidase subunit 2
MGLLPEPSSIAAEVDGLIGGLTIVSLLVLALVLGLMLYFVIRFRETSPLDRGKVGEKSWKFEVSWTAATLLAFFGLFVWGTDLFARIWKPHPNPLTINVIGKQWMWKFEYPGGQREINQLFIPVDRDVQLLMTSEDVIHDFGLPDFRLKHDVLPGRYEALWLHADKTGSYRLFCDQFCGTDHASMIGRVVVLSGPEYQQWLEQNGTSNGLVAQGKALFIRNGCAGCHQNGSSGGGGTVRAPSLNGLYMSQMPLSNGTVVLADDRYIHDSIVYPARQVVASYAPVMPSFNGVLGEEDLVKIIAYIKSLSPRVAEGPRVEEGPGVEEGPRVEEGKVR